MENILQQIEKHKKGIESKYPYLNGLNNEQLSAVLQTEGPVLVFAGAGSGKTRVITYRALHLIKKGLAEPNRILGVTFTNKAAGEMRERIKKALGNQSSLPEFSTFHSFCLKVLRLHAHLIGYKESFIVLDEDDSEKIIKSAVSELNLDEEVYTANKAKAFISKHKSEYISSEEILSSESSPIQKNLRNVYRKYNQKLKELNAMDFDDLLFNSVLLFEEKPFVLDFYKDFYKYIMVDEFQDTNYIQDKFIKMLAGKHKNICVVGDDDQSIYGFRGALVDNILKFKSSFKDCKEVHLGKNYRSNESILSAASNIIRINKKRAEKEIMPVKKGGKPVKVYSFETDEMEAGYIAREINLLVKHSGYSYKNIAILYRINVLSRGIEAGLLNNGIDYQIYGGLKFYQRKEIKDILSFIRFAVNPQDFLSFKRSVQCVPTGAGETTVEKIKRIADENNIDILTAFQKGLLEDIKGLKPKQTDLFEKERTADKPKLLNYFELILKIKEIAGAAKADEIIKTAFEESGYEKLLIEKSEKDAIQNNRIDNIKELIKAASNYSNIQEFLDASALDSEIVSKEENNKVTLATIHAAKGLEFSVVFMVGMEENIFPHAKSLGDDLAIEEERRLCYVGITRAKDLLYMTCAENRRTDKGIKENDISRFIKEIDLKNNN